MGRRRHADTHPACGLPRIAVLALAALTLTACAASEESLGPPPKDYLTDVTDDGSLLMGAFRNDPTTRLVALRALSRLPPSSDTEGLLLKLPEGTNDATVLQEFCFTLGQWGIPASGDVLEQLAGHESSRVRAAAVEALGRLSDDQRTALLVAALDDDASDVRASAALALASLDGSRYDHERQATEEELAARDAALARLALEDPNPGVRWRATYALASVVRRPGHAEILVECLADERTPLVRVFALRGLASLEAEDLSDAAGLARPLVDDLDERVGIEAARVVVGAADPDEVVLLAETHGSPHVRRLAWEALPAAAERARLAGAEVPEPAQWQAAIDGEASPMVRREALAAAAAVGELRGSGPGPWIARLASSPDWRDRERAAQLLVGGAVADEWLDRLLRDDVAAVRGAALTALVGERLERHRDELLLALQSPDPAVRAGAAAAAAVPIADGLADPELVNAVAASLDDTSGYEMEEARVALAAALGMPPLDLAEVPEPQSERLLDRLLVEHDLAAADPHPRVRISTRRGDIELELDRIAAPRHVESFLELAAAGFYDGLEIHRVVPNFVVQGLDPRGDGWGVGGRRLPAEFNRTPYLSGTLGMPRTDTPHTGGCQIFITHVPTPHLDGNYTAFGRVLSGMDVVAALEVGDTITDVQRVEGTASVATP